MMFASSTLLGATLTPALCYTFHYCWLTLGIQLEWLQQGAWSWPCHVIWLKRANLGQLNPIHETKPAAADSGVNTSSGSTDWTTLAMAKVKSRRCSAATEMWCWRFSYHTKIKYKNLLMFSSNVSPARLLDSTWKRKIMHSLLTLFALFFNKCKTVVESTLYDVTKGCKTSHKLVPS